MWSGLKLPAVLVAMVMASCTPLPDIADTGDVSPLAAEELDEIKSDLIQSEGAIQTFMVQTRQGRNLSSVTLGLFVSNMLGQLGRQDAPLSVHLHKGGRFVEGYLTEVFQDHADDEIALIEAMDLPGNRDVRLAAAAALNCLRHIPDPKSPSAEQAEDRAELDVALNDLKVRLDKLVAALP